MRFKRMSEIYSRLVDHTITSTNELNDFSVGSAMRAIYEAVSIELEQFYVLTRENIREAIERGVYSSFGFTRKPAIRAYGTVRINFYNPTQNEVIISRGSRFYSSNTSYPQVYETLTDFRIPEGSVVADIMVYCTSPGSYGNVPSGAINVMNTPLANVKSVINPNAILTGQDEEPLEELRARFRSYIDSLSKGTVPALEYGTREIPEVSGVYVDERPGLVTIYAHDRNGELPDNIRRAIEDNLVDYRAGGIPVEVKAATKKSIDVDVVVTISNKTAITNRLRNDIKFEIEKYLNSMTTSKSLILSDLTRVIMNMDSQLIYDVEFTDLEDNVYIEGYEIIRAGTINVTLK